jgi:glutamate racemase
MRNSAIGIFDSGIGGLTVANAIKNILPNENIIYFGDTEHLPYGEKSKKAIQSFSHKIINFLINKNCKIIVIACNSASSVAEETLANISTSTTILNVIDPVVSEVAKICYKKNIGVIGTKATIKSGIYEKKIKEVCNGAKISSLATPLLAPMIEEGFINEAISNTVITNYLSNSKLTNIDNLILACTHYPLIQKAIKNYYSDRVEMIDSANIVAKYVENQLAEDNLLNKNKVTEHHFYVSNYTQSFERSAKFFFKDDVKLKEIDLFG